MPVPAYKSAAERLLNTPPCVLTSAFVDALPPRQAGIAWITGAGWLDQYTGSTACLRSHLRHIMARYPKTTFAIRLAVADPLAVQPAKLWLQSVAPRPGAGSGSLSHFKGSRRRS